MYIYIHIYVYIECVWLPYCAWLSYFCPTLNQWLHLPICLCLVHSAHFPVLRIQPNHLPSNSDAVDVPGDNGLLAPLSDSPTSLPNSQPATTHSSLTASSPHTTLPISSAPANPPSLQQHDTQVAQHVNDLTPSPLTLNQVDPNEISLDHILY